MRKSILISTTGAIIAVVLLLFPGAPLEADAGSCSVVELEDAAVPGWTNSGAWVTPDRLVLVDALENRLLSYGPKGDFGGDAPEAFQQRLERSVGAFHPSAIVQGGASSYFLELTGGRIAQIRLGGQIVNQMELVGRDLPAGGSIGSVYGWAAGPGQLVGFGDVKTSETGDWQFGYFRVPLRGDGGEILHVLPRSTPERLWYRLGMNYVASIGSRSYLLRVGSELSLVEVDHFGNLERLDIPLEPLRSVPDLPAFETAEDYVRVMRAVEKSTMPVGLYGWKSDLYLLWRSPGPEWFLSKIDIDRGQLVGTAKLPSTANHLFAVPGAQSWAFVEKGPVEGFGFQDVRSITLVPATEIKAIDQVADSLCQ